LEESHIRAFTIQSVNMTTVCNLARQSAATSLLKITRCIFSLLTKADIRIIPEHIPGISNTLADGLSRLDMAGDYELKQEVFDAAIRVLQISPTVDCFTTASNHKCPRFFAPSCDKSGAGAAAINGLNQAWEREAYPYLHSPISLIPGVLQKIRSEKCVVAMVFPFWTTHSRWSSIRPVIRTSIILGSAADVLRKGPLMDPRASKRPQGLLLLCTLLCSQ
jgi:hypothetical protein